MGVCCASKHHVGIEKLVTNRLIEAIEKDSSEKIKQIISRYYNPTDESKNSMLDLDLPCMKLHQYDINPLGYALYLGATESFKAIYEIGHSSLSKMNKFFMSIGKRPIDVICELGYHTLLEYYLPIFLKENKEVSELDEDSEELSIFSRSRNTKSHTHDKSKVVSPASTFTPIQRAVEKGKLSVVKFLCDYFKDQPTHQDFDVHHFDETTGENCALISCRTGNLEMMSFL